MLTTLLISKILVTLLFLVIPFLFFSKQKLQSVMKLEISSAQIFRLYGVALLALTVAYAFGLGQVVQQEFPTSTVWMGIVSNGGATSVLIGSGGWRQSRLMKALTVFFGLVAAGFVVSALAPGIAMGG